MDFYTWFWMDNVGEDSNTIQIPLDPTRSFLVMGYLTATQDGDYAHIYIAEVCTQVESDFIACGDNPEHGAKAVDTISNATSVTFGFRTNGGYHRAEGVVLAL